MMTDATTWVAPVFGQFSPIIAIDPGPGNVTWNE